MSGIYPKKVRFVELVNLLVFFLCNISSVIVDIGHIIIYGEILGNILGHIGTKHPSSYTLIKF